MRLPIEDLMTPEVTRLICNIKTKQTAPITFVYGKGSNGKTLFFDLLKKIYNCCVLPSESFICTPVNKNAIYMGVDNNSLDFFLISELSYDQKTIYNLLQEKTLTYVKERGIPVIIVLNWIPDLKDFDNSANDVELIQFTTQFIDPNYASSHREVSDIVNDALPIEQVATREALEYMRNIAYSV